MFEKIFNTKIKKISTAIIILFLVFGFFKKINALTIADIELLISIGLIPVERADSAREFLNSQKTSNTGSSLKTDNTSSAECIVLDKNLVKGNSGTAVSALQRFLKSEGHFPADQSITGYFGDLTVQAMTDFQIASGLISSSKQIGAGTVGPVSRKKVQEISCKRASEEKIKNSIVVDPAPVAQFEIATTTSTSTKTTKKQKIEKSIVPVASILVTELKSNKSDGEFEFKYNIKIEPDDNAAVFKIILVCDPSAVEVKARDIGMCGEFFEYKISRRASKTVNINYKNLSRSTQPVIFGLEVLDLNRLILGSAETRNNLTAAEPKYYFDSKSNSLTYTGSNFKDPQLCNRQDQIEHIRFAMSPFDPLNINPLPNCWPGDILCDYSYPPKFCEIAGGPSSDDLCLSSQKFVNGQCVAKI